MAAMSAALARRTFKFGVSRLSQELEAVFGNYFRLRAPDVIRLQPFRRHRFPGQKLAQSQARDRARVYCVDLQHRYTCRLTFLCQSLIWGDQLRSYARPGIFSLEHPFRHDSDRTARNLVLADVHLAAPRIQKRRYTPLRSAAVSDRFKQRHRRDW